MLKKIDKRIPIIIVLLIIYIILLFFYFKSDNNSNIPNGMPNMNMQKNKDKSSDSSNESTSKETVTSSASVQAALTEKMDVHNTYKLKELYVEENDQISKDDKVIKYTNGEYLKAPYDAIITDISMPDEGETITNQHYIEISSINTLKLELNISESKISNISIGDDATITISSLSKEYTGKVTNISNTATNSKFTVTVEFENDGDVMIGMSASVTI